MHCVLLAAAMFRNGPGWYELHTVAAGCEYVRTLEFERYKVNPPVLPYMSCLPISLFLEAPPIIPYGTAQVRTEFAYGISFATEYGNDLYWIVLAARWACLPCSLLAAASCYGMAKSLYGSASAVLALALWCTSPLIIGYGAFVSHDIAAASLCVTTSYVATWKSRSTWWTIGCGILGGMAILCKFTSFAILPTVVLSVVTVTRYGGIVPIIHILASFSLALCITLNAGYAFKDTGTCIGSYEWQSEFLRELAMRLPKWTPVPLPRLLVEGVDLQKSDFEARHWSYAAGRWKKGGWWTYYLYVLCVKQPTGTLLLLGFAVVHCARSVRPSRAELLSVMGPAIALLLLASSQTGLNEHGRYAIPTLPYLFVFLSRVSLRASRRLIFFTRASTTWALASMLTVYPHCVAYFGELVGGPENASNLLASTNVSMGEEAWGLARWAEALPTDDTVLVAPCGEFVIATACGCDRLTLLSQSACAEARESEVWLVTSLLPSRHQTYCFDFSVVSRTEPFGYSLRAHRLRGSDIKWLTANEDESP